jgi:Na+-translocating ferredoxin:NAD+ oxidoreductase RnfA subunit
MDYLLDLLQGAGLAAAIGIRPFLPVLLAGALAVADVGLDFEGTDFSFLETWPFLLAVLVLVVLLDFAGRRAGRERAEVGIIAWVLLGLAVVLGALEAAGSIADHSEDWWPGVPIGIASAALGYAAARSLFARVRRRLDSEAAAALPVYAEAIALAAAGLSILFPPLAVLVLAALLWLMVGSRRRAGEKYAGLRILR